MGRLFQFLLIAAVFALSTSCVPTRRFQEEVDAKQAAQTQAAKEAKLRKEADEARAAAETRIEELEEDYEEIKEDYDRIKKSYDTQQKLSADNETAFGRLQSKYNEMIELLENMREERDNYKQERNEYRDKYDRCQAKYESMESRYESLEDKIKDLERQNEDLKKQLEGNLSDKDALEALKKQLEADLADREKRIKELEEALAERDRKAKALREKLENALKGFSSSDLTVEIKNGKVYISLSQKLLFSKGSSKINSQGVDALGKLAGVLKDQADLDILVEGHTDSDGDAKTNWKLSTERSLAVTYELIDGDVPPGRITAAGRGEHMPKASNDDETGKAKNRRTEIILAPQLEELFEIINN